MVPAVSSMTTRTRGGVVGGTASGRSARALCGRPAFAGLRSRRATQAPKPRNAAGACSSTAAPSCFRAREFAGSPLFAGGRGLAAAAKGERKGARAGAGVARAKPDFGDRIIASVPYLLPLLDGLRYGRFFFKEFPQSYALLAPLQPLIKVYYTLPFASLVVFFALYYGIVNNFNFSRFVRYNAMQTILLDILLIVPSLVENFILRDIPKTGTYLQILISFYNFVWLYVLICVLYGVAAR